jgi:hypothetical protein
MKKLITYTVLLFSSISGFAQTFDYSDLDKGYVEWENINSFCFDLTANAQSQSLPLDYNHIANGNAIWAIGSYTPSVLQACTNRTGRNTYQISSVGTGRFRAITAWSGINLMEDCSSTIVANALLPVYGGYIPTANNSDYIKKNVLKRVYYGNDANGLIYLRELSATTHPDGYFTGSLFCFAPYTSTGATNFNYNTGNLHFDRPKFQVLPLSYYLSQTQNSDRSIATRAFSIKNAGSTGVFNAGEWANASWAKDVESYQDVTGRVRNLNGGVEVYVVYAHQEQIPGYAGSPSGSAGHYDGTLDGVSYRWDRWSEFLGGGEGGFFGLLGTWSGLYRYANLGRVHVYPSRPKWRESVVKPNYCSSDVVDLLNLIDLGSGKFSGKFVIERGDAAILNGTTVDFSKLGTFTNDATIGIRCYPYYTEDNDFNISMYMEVTVKINTQLNDTGEQMICSGNSNTFLARYLPMGGTYTGSYIKDNSLDVPAAVKAGLSAIAVTYKYETEGCATTGNYTQTITNGPDVTFENIGTICTDKELNLESYVIPSGGTFSGRGVHDGVFSPSLAGMGEQTITYKLSGETCETVVTKDVIVSGLYPIISFKPVPILCQNAEFIDLMDYLDGFDVDPGGSFSGTGVQNTHYFYPDKAKAGINIITYTYGSGTCRQSIKVEITVKEVPALSFTSVGNVCTVAPIDLANVPNIKGGTFTGIGVQDNVFMPELAGLGTVMLNYTGIAENGCSVLGVLPVLITDLLPSEVNFEPIPQFCKNDNDYYELSPYVTGHSGGAFTGKGVEGNRFYPNKATAGFNVITYTYGTGTCKRSIQTEIYVKSVESLSFASVGNVCTVAPVDLTNVPNVKGGIFTGAGVSENLFNPEVASTGVTEINYSVVSETGCPIADKFSIVVTDLLPTDVKFGSISEFCGNDNNYYELSPYITGHSGGTFSGRGVENNRFYPNKATAGFNVITYTYGTGVCKRSIQTEIYVNALPVVNFSNIGNVCDKSAIDLTKYVTPAGGTFTGTGTDNGKFYPAVAGLGSHSITYEAFIGDCPVVGSTMINVVGLADSDASIRAIEEVCKTSEDYLDLRGYLVNAPDNGVFSGTGVENGRFYPARAKEGFNVIRYNFTVGTCNKTITAEIFVRAVPSVNVRSVSAICDKTAINLSNYVDIKGGIFTGAGVSGDMFLPDAAGIGKHDIKYTVQFGDCFNAATMTINVLDLREADIAFKEFPTFCKSDSSYIDLRTYIRNHEGGTFAGTGIENYRFYPSRAREGFNTISYTYGDGSCKKTISSEILIRPVPTINVRALPKICQNDIILNLSGYVTPAGGLFTGIGITSDGIVETSSLDVGKYSFYYNYRDDNMCWNNVPLSLDVVDLCSSNIKWKNTVPSLCNGSASDDYIDLREYIEDFNEDGTFSGTGVENYRFYPSRGKVGFNTISYTFGTGSCKKTVKTEIFVNAIPVVTIGTLPKICQNNITLNLMKYATPADGIFAGTGVTPDGIVAAAVLGTGKHTFYYDYQDDNACSVRTPLQIDIVDLCSPKTRWISELPQLCNTNADYINLSEYIEDFNEDGTFSGTGVENGRFYPSRAKEGFNVISYTFGEGTCKKTIKAEFFVKTAQAILLNNIPRICDKGSVDLTNLVNIKGGDFYYANTKIDLFHPENFGLGKHELQYRVNYDGCVSVAALTLEVADLMEADIKFDGLPTMCISDDSYYDLTSYVQSHTGGTFSGTGVENGRFYPSRAKEGFNTISYTYGDGACKKTIKAEVLINAPAAIVLNNIPRICSKDVINLSNLVNLKGGTFNYAGSNISELFYPENFGIGKHEISYAINYNECVSKTKFNIEIADVMEANIGFDSIPVMCKQDLGFIDLRSYIRNHEGGTFSGAGVQNGRFYPSQAKIGFNTVSYTYGESACQKIVKYDIEIVDYTGVSVSFSPIAKRCDATLVTLLDYVNIKTGTFTGSGVIGSIFYPDVAGIGKHEISYMVRDSIFNIYANTTIEVISLLSPDVRFKTLPAFCRSQEAIDLTEYIENNEDGTFTGKGVKNNRYFYPNEVTTEDNVITYTYGTDVCKRSISATAKVYSAPNNGVIEIDDVIACCGSRLDLGRMINPAGGTFTGNYITPDGIYSGDIATIGEVHITYSIANKGCTISKEIIIRNESIDPLDFSTTVEVVDNGGKIRFIPPSTDEISYRWDFGDGGYSLETSPWHYYYHPGTHTVSLEMHDRKGCIRSAVKEHFISVIVNNNNEATVQNMPLKAMYVGGVEYTLQMPESPNDLQEALADVQIYPNPTTGLCWVRGFEQLERIIIFDSSGEIFQDTAASSSIHIPTKAGIYLVRCIGKNKQVKVIKIVKQ